MQCLIKKFKNMNLKPILCFYIGYDNEVNDEVKNLAENLTEFYDVFIFGSFNNPPYKEENIRYLNISNFYHFKTYNDINTVIIYKYLNYLLEFDVKLMSKRTHLWLPHGVYNPYWDFKLLPNDGVNLIKNSIDKIDGLITTNYDDLWDLKASLPQDKIFFIDNQKPIDWINYLLEGVNLMRFEIFNRNFEKGLRVLASYLPKNTVMAEIGSYTGESTSIFLDSGNIKTLYAIDPWTQWSWEQEYDATCYTNFEQVENLFDKRVKGDPRLVKLKMTINEAKEYMPPQLDFIYIDGNHDYEPVKNDIIESLKLIKPGGIIAGHDYVWGGVKRAVDELLGEVDFYFIDDSWFKYV
jgi:predicted O-methyltransferase YrrM